MNLTLDNVTLTYPDGDTTLTAINKADMAEEPGEFTAIVGPSGSGKSSLLAVVGTLIRPQEGRQLINECWMADQRGLKVAQDGEWPYNGRTNGEVKPWPPTRSDPAASVLR